MIIINKTVNISKTSKYIKVVQNLVCSKIVESTVDSFHFEDRHTFKMLLFCRFGAAVTDAHRRRAHSGKDPPSARHC